MTTPAPHGALITVPTFDTPTAGVPFVVHALTNYPVASQATLRYSASSAAVSFAALPAGSTVVASGAGSLITVVGVVNGNATPHTFEIEDTAFTPPLVSNSVGYNVVAAPVHVLWSLVIGDETFTFSVPVGTVPVLTGPVTA